VKLFIGRTVTITLAVLLPVYVAALERLEPPEGCYIGFSLQSGNKISDLRSTLGITPAVYGGYFGFPWSEAELAALTNFLNEVMGAGGIAMVTLEPWGGLQTVSENACLELAGLCSSYEARGITGVLIRLGHEMNGNWYPWGQRPILFKQTFRLLAESLRPRTKRSAMLWAPNHGLGYPFGAPAPNSASPDFADLDTNNDGIISQQDDMYEPYYPGNDVVDWVGLTLYHWGNPWLENAPPSKNMFIRSIVGRYGADIPDFYRRYCASRGRQKPMAIPETAAFYNTERGGRSELEVKQGWWQQVFNSGAYSESADIATYYPQIKCIGWFDQLKREGVAENNLIDWRVSADPEIRTAFVNYLRAPRTNYRPPHHLTAEEARCLLFSMPCASAERFSVQIRSDDGDLVWPSALGRSYQLFASSDLIHWAPMGSVISGTGRTIRIARPVDGEGAAFYRVRAAPQQ
jgi:hypothetical protein